ncbi:MAG TPA: periplasmic heavy metal sensor [Rhizobacter sp.]|nr:periplasmic heavy metal sensor [Rhizobacter sp.]
MKSNAMKALLVVSLLVNLFLVGGIAGGTWRWWVTQGPGSVAAQPRGLRFAAEELSPERQRAYRMGLREARHEAAAAVQAAREGREQVLQLLAAPTLDRAAVAAALARTREADAAVRSGYEARVVEFAATLSPAERQQLASGLARRSGLGPAASAPLAPPRNP